ncbi:ankyrin repeat domain-containing protein [Lutispora thermophila]|uniref:Uncharacterized protein n=1 Tax=Lutispora thermophila DSM 19022 TaxID=1122184 RepID=A0A1M6DPT8_9FIRM|nr:ankyrin repeat domain-containing protein [Lutispora thermophila]SHI75202.1 hypothetical protein SAMN02745176_01221 [Lutispora thermophila DSM 19022]
MLNKGSRATMVLAAVFVSVIMLLNFNNIVLSADSKTTDGLQEENSVILKSDDEKRVSNMEFTIDMLTQAVLENNIALVKRILASGTVDINSQDSEGQYPIEMVLVMGNCDMAKILLEAGADPYVITSSGKSVYDLVMEGDNTYLKKIFKQYAK